MTTQKLKPVDHSDPGSLIKVKNKHITISGAASEDKGVRDFKRLKTLTRLAFSVIRRVVIYLGMESWDIVSDLGLRQKLEGSCHHLFLGSCGMMALGGSLFAQKFEQKWWS